MRCLLGKYAVKGRKKWRKKTSHVVNITTLCHRLLHITTHLCRHPPRAEAASQVVTAKRRQHVWTPLALKISFHCQISGAASVANTSPYVFHPPYFFQSSYRTCHVPASSQLCVGKFLNFNSQNAFTAFSFIFSVTHSHSFITRSFFHLINCLLRRFLLPNASEMDFLMHQIRFH